MLYVDLLLPLDAEIGRVAVKEIADRYKINIEALLLNLLKVSNSWPVIPAVSRC